MVPRDAHNVTRLWSPDALKEDKKTKEGQTGNRSNRCEKLAMEVEVEEKDLKAAGAERLTGGRRGLRIHGWEIESRKCSILNSSTVQQYTNIHTLSLLYCLFMNSKFYDMFNQ